MVKYALLIGINYRKTEAELNGCINDVHKMRSLLINSFGYSKEDIVLLTEDNKPNLQPTALNIMNQLGSLIMKAYSNKASEIWVHYSGHGSYIKDNSGDEADGQDEVLVPLDYKKAGYITDDLIHNYMEYLPEETRVFCLFDCCHSGTIMDLKYRYMGADIEGNCNYNIENKNSKVKGNVIMISGCQDNQVSMDALIGNNWAGAMTSAFIDALERCKFNITFYHLLELMKKYLKRNGYKQLPQLCCSKQLSPISIFCSECNIEPMFYTEKNHYL
jgi:hypothetical protein